MSVVVLTGPPCSGKSSVGSLLRNDHRIPIEVDAVFDLLLPGSDRNRHDRLVAYDGAHALARAVADAGRTPILECTYARREQRASLASAFAGISLSVVEFVISADDAAERFRGREQATDLDEASVRERVENFPYSSLAFALPAVGATPDELAGAIEAWLADGPPSVDTAAWVAAGRGWG